MTGGLDQLLFTWIQQGPEGRRGFQVVAASTTLLDPANPQRLKAIELCRYRPPHGVREPSAAPISYGWTADNGYRYAFHKVYLGSDGFGRPGNFAAHVIVGPARDVPVAMVPALFDSPWWWRGGSFDRWLDDDGQLPAIYLDAIQPGPARSMDIDPGPLVEAVFAAEGHRIVAIRDTPSSVCDAVGALAGRAPWLLDHIAFSTFEPPGMSASFIVVGVGPTGEVPPGALLLHTETGRDGARDAATVVLSGKPHGDTVTRIALAIATSNTDSLDIPALVQSIEGFDRLLRGGAVDPALLRAALISRSGVTALLTQDGGVATLGAALVAGEPVDWQAVRDTCATRADLDDRLSEAVANMITDWSETGSILRRAAAISGRFHERMCLALCRHPGFPARHIGAATAVGILVGVDASRSAVDRAVLRMLALAASDDLSGALAADLNRDVLGLILANAMERPDADLDRVTNIAANEPALVGYAAPHLHDPRTLVRLLHKADRGGMITVARTVLRALPAVSGYDFLAAYVSGMEPDRMLTLLAECWPSNGYQPDPRWGTMIRGALHQLTAHALSTTAPYRPPSGRILNLLSAVSCGPVCEVLLQAVSREPTPVSAWPVLGELGPGSDSRLAAELALTFLFQRRPNLDDVCWAASSIGGTRISEHERTVLLLRAAQRAVRDDPTVAEVATRYVIRSVRPGTRVPKSIQDLTKTLTANCMQHELVSLDAFAEKIGPDAEEWWRSVRYSKLSQIAHALIPRRKKKPVRIKGDR